MDKQVQVGYVGVDAGLCWIGDPCYILPDDRTENVGRDWSKFCDDMDGELHKSFNYNRGHQGVGCCVQTGWGDGSYPVFATINEDGRITKAEIIFIDDEEEF